MEYEQATHAEQNLRSWNLRSPLTKDSIYGVSGVTESTLIRPARRQIARCWKKPSASSAVSTARWPMPLPARPRRCSSVRRSGCSGR